MDSDYVIGGDPDCAHSQGSFLGLMGPTAMYECDRCSGVITAGME